MRARAHTHTPGRYPKDTVSVISLICRSAEAVFDHHQHFDTQAEAEEQLLEHKRALKVCHVSLSCLYVCVCVVCVCVL